MCNISIFFCRPLSDNPHSLLDPDHSDTDESDAEQPEAISFKRVGKGAKRKARKKQPSSAPNDADANQPSRVIYLGHLPAGFEDTELRTFLNQFGNVSRCRVSRSTKTGRSRGYAFVEFADAEVAKIVADAMSGYFLLEKRLVCHLLPHDRVHELMFKKPKRVLTKADKQKAHRAEANKKRSAEALKGITAKLVEREERKRKKLAALGIDYDFPGYAAGAKSMEGEEGAEVEPVAEKKRKLSDVGEGDDGANDAAEEAATPKPKSEKKKKKKSVKKSKRESVENAEEEKENDATPEPKEATAAKASSKKKKKSKAK